MFSIFSRRLENQKDVYLETFQLVRPNSPCDNKKFQKKVFEKTFNLLRNYLDDQFVIKTDLII